MIPSCQMNELLSHSKDNPITFIKLQSDYIQPIKRKENILSVLQGSFLVLPVNWRLLNIAYIDPMNSTIYSKWLEFLLCPKLLKLQPEALSCDSTFCTVFSRYFKQVEDVLKSVQKTEESLRRLKQIRERTTGESRSSGGDDEKIRQQLLIDVTAYCKAVSIFHRISTYSGTIVDLIGICSSRLNLGMEKVL